MLRREVSCEGAAKRGICRGPKKKRPAVDSKEHSGPYLFRYQPLPHGPNVSWQSEVAQNSPSVKQFDV